LVIENCTEVLRQPEFNIRSSPIEVIGFKWHLQATIRKIKINIDREFNQVHLLLHAKAPNNLNNRPFRIETEWLVVF
jgi:hypothetical protein